MNDPWGNALERTVHIAGALDELERGTCDDDGNPVRVELDSDGDGVLDTIDTNVSSDGLLRSGEHDFDADGATDGTSTHTYDTLRRRTRWTLSWVDTGLLEAEYFYTDRRV